MSWSDCGRRRRRFHVAVRGLLTAGKKGGIPRACIPGTSFVGDLETAWSQPAVVGGSYSQVSRKKEREREQEERMTRKEKMERKEKRKKEEKKIRSFFRRGSCEEVQETFLLTGLHFTVIGCGHFLTE